ncbi:sulfite exporter TauE/SafE family protein [Planctomycetota bacterium]|nr:sulfite exporter TauE/SafE family protein [Planctomycetota bacterium]
MELIVPFAVLMVFASIAKGAIGAASAIVFNAGLLVTIMVGGVPNEHLITGLLMIAITDFFTGAFMFFSLRKELKAERISVRLLAGLLPVSVVFALLLTKIDLLWVAVILGASVMGGGIYLLTQTRAKPWREQTTDRLAFPTGVLSGTLAGLFGMGGPIIFILLSRAGDDPSVFRRRTVVISTTAAFARLITLILAGVLTRQHWELSGLMIPFIIFGLVVGMWMHHKVKPRPFKLVLGGLVFLAGCGGVLKSLM